MARQDYEFPDTQMSLLRGRGGGGVRVLWNAWLDNMQFEAGISRFAPNAQWPVGASTYRAIGQAQTNWNNEVVIQVAGIYEPTGEGSEDAPADVVYKWPAEGTVDVEMEDEEGDTVLYTLDDEPPQWMSRVVDRSWALSVLAPLRHDTGARGSGGTDERFAPDANGEPQYAEWGSEFLAALSEVTGHEWKEVGCVRVYTARY